MLKLGWFVLATALCAPLSAEQVYRWLDENGQVHYGASPGSDSAEKINVRSKRAISDDPNSERHRHALRERVLQSYAKERQDKAAQKQREVTEKQRRSLRCKQLTRHWKNLNHYGPIYYRNKVGGRDFLGPEERAAEKESVRGDLKKYCGEIPKG